MLESLIGLFELPEDTSTGDDEHFVDVEDTPGKKEDLYDGKCHPNHPTVPSIMTILFSKIMLSLILKKGYQGSFNQLYSTTKADPDPFKGEIPNAKFYLAKSLENLSVANPSRVPQFLSQISPSNQNHLQVYLNEANVRLR